VPRHLEGIVAARCSTPPPKVLSESGFATMIRGIDVLPPP
jgi:hypothetical protein